MSLEFINTLSNEEVTLTNENSGQLTMISEGDCIINLPSNTHMALTIYLPYENTTCVINSTDDIVGGLKTLNSIKMYGPNTSLSLFSDATQYCILSGAGIVQEN